MENEYLKATEQDNLEETIGEERWNKMLECWDGRKVGPSKGDLAKWTVME